MKNNLLIYYLFLLLFAFCTSCSDNNENLKEENLPVITKSFIERYLPDHEILKIEDMKPQGEELDKYLVSFSDGLTIVFNKLGYWWRVESESQVPESLLEAIDAKELEALKNKYPDLKVKCIYNDFFAHELLYSDAYFHRRMVLADDTEVFLYSYPGRNTINVGVHIKGQPDKIPSEIKSFFDEYYENAEIDLLLHAIEDESEEVYKVYFTPSNESLAKESSATDRPKINGLIVFDSKGEWLSAKHPSVAYPITEKLFESLSSYAKEYMSKNYPDAAIYEITKIDEHYQFRFDESKHTLVRCNENPLFRLDLIQGFIWEHFNPNYIDENIKAERRIQDKSKRYYITVEINDVQKRIVYMETLADGIWLYLETPGSYIPESVIDTLPKGIKDWINKKGIQKEVVKIIKKDDGGFSLFVRNTMLVFDKNGELVTA